ncbi:MAG: glycosyltransferase family 4 protein [Cyclobacteriaceae bacterium]
MRKRLQSEGIDLKIIYGKPSRTEQLKGDNVTLEWGAQITNRTIKVFRISLLWQPVLSYIEKGDLVIVEQASKLLSNYVLLLLYKLGRIRLGYWGHGKNLQARKNQWQTEIGELLKKRISKQVHWWFAYNDLSMRIVEKIGFPSDRISSVHNTINTDLFLAHNTTNTAIQQYRQKYRIRSENVCIFMGSLYEEKRIPFLLNACNRIRELVPDFEMIIVGAGPSEHLVRDVVKKYDWIHYLGPKFGEEKLELLALAKLLLMPGLVGLAVIDAFASETPLITTNIDYHSPEIDYLVNGYNGVIVNNPEDYQLYAHEASLLLSNNDQLKILQTGCRESREKYTLNNMVDRYSNGILLALNN